MQLLFRYVQLNEHINAFHEQKKLFKCNCCSKAFAYSNNLSTHKKNVHDSKKIETFKCEQCELVFSTTNRLY